MSDAKDQHEPSMEEILASIRRIISEDGEAQPAAGEAAAANEGAAAADGAAAAAPAAAAAATIAVSAGAAADDDVLVLTEEVEDQPPAEPAAPPFALPNESEVEEIEAQPVEEVPERPNAEFDEPPPEPPPPPPPRPRTVEAEDDRLISETTAAASVAALTELVSRSHREPDIESVPLGNANRTLEDITRELLRPYLKSWLDDNLPEIVERIVREEIGRLAIDAQRR